MRRNIDICTLYKDKKFQLNLVIRGRFYEVVFGGRKDNNKDATYYR